MKTVYLHGKLGKRFGKKWKLSVDSAQEAYSAIEANTEGFFEYIFNAAKNGTEYIAITKHPKDIKNENDLRENIIDLENSGLKNKNKEIHVLNIASGSITAFMQFMFVGGTVSGGLTLGGMIVTSLAISFAMQALMKPPEPPRRKDPLTTKSFLIAGGLTRQAQGIAVPVGYGRLKIGCTNVATRKTSEKLTDSENADTLESYTKMEFIDLLSEGPIHGFVDQYGGTLNSEEILQSIYLNEVQVKNSSGSYNYIMNEDIDGSGKPEYKLGDDSDSKILSEGVFYIKEYDNLIYGPPPYKEDQNGPILKHTISSAISNDAKIISHFVSNPAVSEVTFSFRSELFTQADDGSMLTNSINFAILISRSGEYYNVLEPVSSGCEIIKMGGGVEKVGNEFNSFIPELGSNHRYNQIKSSDESKTIAGILEMRKIAQEYARFSSDVDGASFQLSGIATSTYQFDITIQFDNTSSFQDRQGTTFKVIKLSPEYDPSVKGGDFGGVAKTRRLQVAHVEEKINENLIYPHSAMTKIIVDSKNFSNAPDRQYHLKLKKVLIPTNYDPVSRKYDGPWDGLFQGQSDSSESIHSISDKDKKWTDNPAWVFFDLLHNARYGVGKYGLEEENIDKWQLYKIAKYCDELVETDYHIETVSGNPRRFSCSNVLKDSAIEIQIDPGEYTGRYVPEENPNDYQITKSSSSEITAEAIAIFKEEFGDKIVEEYGFQNKNYFKGKKIAFFIHKPNGNISDDEIAFRSAVRDGEIEIQERIIMESDPDNLKLLVSGPKFDDGVVTIGACATQINHPIVEPRFSANLYLTDRAEALEVIKNLASIFRGMSAYSGGKILAIQDSLKKPIQLFNSSNVSKDGFTYSGVHKNKRISACLVRFNNASKNYRPDLVYEEDADAIQKFGYTENETMGMGITSESQARRLAKWILLTSQLETETVNFITGQEGSYLFPGSIFEISDESRVGKSKSGRILDIQNSRTIFLNGQSIPYNDPYILIDKSIEDDPVLSKAELTVCVGLSNETQESIEQRAKFEKLEYDQDVEIESLNTPQFYKFQASLKRNDSIARGPQGQRTIACNLVLKIPFTVDLEKNTIQKYDHNFKTRDKIYFLTDGVLPGGLNQEYVYYIINETKHTFQVSIEDPFVVGPQAVNILDEGRDNLLNKGGDHYFSPYRETDSVDEKTQEALDQISVGSSYSIKGFIGVNSSEILSKISFEDNLRTSKDLGHGWFVSDLFGPIWVSKNQGTVFSSRLNQWIGVENIIDYGIGNSNSWFYSDALEWVWITESENGYYWYFNKLNVWIFVKPQANFFFYYQDNPSVSQGDAIQFVNDVIFVKNVIEGSVSGYYFSFYEKSDEYDLSAPTDDTSSLSAPSPLGLKTSAISEMIFISAEDSIQGFSCIRIALENGHGLDIIRNNKISISGFSSNDSALDSIINSDWFTIYVNENSVELINSEHASTLLNAATISQNGNISFVESAKSEVERYLESQLFRTLSVKEVSENKYEVVGLEYNSSKFDAVDSKGVIKKPHLPIPPQADMSIPDAPTDLILNDLTL